MSRSLRFLTAALLVLVTGALAHAAALIVVERRFPLIYCPIDNDDFNLTFVAEGPFVRISFDAANYADTDWLHRRLDNIAIVAKSVYDANKFVTPGYSLCYDSPGHLNTPGYNFVSGSPEVYLNLFDTNADGWDLNHLAYFEPAGGGVSAPRDPAVGSDKTGGALGLGKIGDGAVNVSTSVLVSGLTAGTQYILTGWWYEEVDLRPMTVTIDTAPCLDRDGDGVGDCTDCDDRNPKRKPGATEVCDGVDNDCDGLVDENAPCDRVCDTPSKVGGSDLRVTNAVFSSDKPSLVWNGTDFGMFYKDSRNGGQELFFSRVSVTGAKIGGDSNLLPGFQSTSPRAVWTGSEYGVVWEDGSVVGFRRFDRNGAPIGTEVVLGGTSPGAFTPDIVWTGKEYGIVWAQYVVTPEIFFTRLAPDATPLIPNPVQLSLGNNPSDPRLAWNGTHYGVVWQGSSAAQTVFFRRVAPLDVKTGTIVELTPGTGGSFAPAIAAGGTDWGVAYADYRNGFDSEIYFSRVNAAGAEVGSDTRVTNATGASMAPSIAWSGSEWGIACEDYRSGDSEQWFARVTAAGAKIGTDFRVTTAGDTSQQGSLVWAGGKYALAYSDYRNSGEQEIYFTRIGCDCVNGDGDAFTSCEDCDDGRAATFPGATQVCDGFNNNCNDVNWPITSEVDADADTFLACADCNDASNAVWTAPGEVRSLLMSHDKVNNVTNISWLAPTNIGGTAASITYDTVRSVNPSNFVGIGVCVESNNGPNTVAADPVAPTVGQRFYYLIRGENACPSGQGSLGNQSNGTPRTARTCP
ncbi:MAG TPA: putative metal-binding motif-containing protein [Candidatus Polarisedimenticolaceae bacterium]|nr:putative metal-binding motif-containing protein [Candidatus Polarisedimenticolaceae bacterium]